VVGSNLTQDFWVIFNIQRISIVLLPWISVSCDSKCRLFDNLILHGKLFSPHKNRITIYCASYLSGNNIHDMTRKSLCSDLSHNCTSHWECFVLEEYREWDSQQKTRTVSYKILTNKSNIKTVSLIQDWCESQKKTNINTEQIPILSTGITGKSSSRGIWT
jgi:hypothetical protein